MINDEYEKLADAIWQGNTLTIAALQDMTADDLHEVEKALADKYKVDINLNTDPAQIRNAVANARATTTVKLDRTLREASAED